LEVRDVVSRLGAECREFVLSNYERELSKLAEATSANVGDLARCLAALGSDLRLRILLLLTSSSKPLPACLISALLGKNPQLVSYHLRVLRECGIVREIEVDKFRLYTVDRDALAMIVLQLSRALNLDICRER